MTTTPAQGAAAPEAVQGSNPVDGTIADKAAAELRRLHAECAVDKPFEDHAPPFNQWRGEMQAALKSAGIYAARSPGPGNKLTLRWPATARVELPIGRPGLARLCRAQFSQPVPRQAA